MSLADPLIRSRAIKPYAAAFSAMTLHRHILAGRFPSPAATINGQRYWRRSDLIAWRDGRRSGWPSDPDIAARRERMAPVRAARRAETRTGRTRRLAHVSNKDEGHAVEVDASRR
jgi:hypothetical protein